MKNKFDYHSIGSIACLIIAVIGYLLNIPLAIVILFVVIGVLLSLYLKSNPESSLQ